MNYKAILFDLDGTLLNTLQDLAKSMNSGLARLGFPQHEADAYKHFVGEGREVMAERALPAGNRDESTVAKLADLFNEEYGIHWADSTAPYDGIPEMLDAITALGPKMVVLSNKPHGPTLLTVSHLLSRWRFDVVMGARPSVPRKPDPTSAIQIAEEVGVQPEEFLYLGDSDIDMKTAVGAGMYPVGALWGFRTRDELLAGGAKGLVRHPTELLPML